MGERMGGDRMGEMVLAGDRVVEGKVR